MLPYYFCQMSDFSQRAFSLGMFNLRTSQSHIQNVILQGTNAHTNDPNYTPFGTYSK